MNKYLTRICTYRANMRIFRVLIGLLVATHKLLLVWAQMAH